AALANGPQRPPWARSLANGVSSQLRIDLDVARERDRARDIVEADEIAVSPNVLKRFGGKRIRSVTAKSDSTDIAPFPILHWCQGPHRRLDSELVPRRPCLERDTVALEDVRKGTALLPVRRYLPAHSDPEVGPLHTPRIHRNRAKDDRVRSLQKTSGRRL